MKSDSFQRYDYYLIGETHPDSRCTDLQKIIDMYVSHTFLLECLKQLDVKNFYQEGALIRELGDSEATLKPEVRERIELVNKRKIKFHWLDEGIKEYTLIRKMNSEGRMFTREWFILQKKRREKWYEKITKESIICVGLWHVPYLFKELSQRGSCYLYPKNWWDNPTLQAVLNLQSKVLGECL